MKQLMQFCFDQMYSLCCCCCWWEPAGRAGNILLVKPVCFQDETRPIALRVEMEDPDSDSTYLIFSCPEQLNWWPCPLLGLTELYNQSLHKPTEWPHTLVTFGTFDQSDEETWPDQKELPIYPPTYLSTNKKIKKCVLGFWSLNLFYSSQ